MLCAPKVSVRRTVLKTVLSILCVTLMVACSRAADVPEVSLTLECDSLDSDYLGARYQVSHAQGKNAGQYELTLWRVGTVALHSYSEPAISRSYAVSRRGDIYEHHYFDADRRAIEFEARATEPEAAEQFWQEKRTLVTEDFRSRLKLVDEQGESCTRLAQYSGEVDELQYQLLWWPELDLPAYFSVTDHHGDPVLSWTFIELNPEADAAKQALADRQAYMSTDFADIGDNETDPFLRNMINLGFIDHGNSGFYDSEGNDMGAANDHHGHAH